MAGIESRTFSFSGGTPERIDHFLAEKISHHSRSRIQKLIKDGFVTVNEDVITKTGFMLSGANISVNIKIPEPAPTELIPESIPLDIIFENEDLIAINKPAGMVVHPAAGHQSGTLVHAVLGHDPNIEGVGGERRPGVVHRLDKNTSGVIILAKNDLAHRWLQKQFKSRNVEKKYVALVDRHPPTDSGKIDAPIFRDRVKRKQMAIAPSGRGREAVTLYRTIRKFKKHSFLEIDLLTGRTHQIRLHLASIGSPITGDTVYGFSTPSIKLNRHFLHAQSLDIRLPGSKQFRVFTAELPKELKEIINDLDNEDK